MSKLSHPLTKREIDLPSYFEQKYSLEQIAPDLYSNISVPLIKSKSLRQKIDKMQNFLKKKGQNEINKISDKLRYNPVIFMVLKDHPDGAFNIVTLSSKVYADRYKPSGVELKNIEEVFRSQHKEGVEILKKMLNR